MQISAIAAKIGLPEERVAQIAQMIKSQGLADSQMGPMMRMATEKGVEPREILDMLTSLGVPQGQVVRVMSSQGLIDDTEAQRLIEEERRAAEARAAADKQSGARRFARKAGIIAFWLAIWQLLDVIIDNRLVLAGPIRVAQALVEQIGQPDFWVICGASFGRIALGFLLSFVVGFLLALISCRHRLFRDFVDPIISLLRTIPVASFIILLLIWVGNQALTVFLAFFIVLPLIYTACPRKERELRAHAALRSVSLDERLYDHRSNELSGGQMQRVAIARALVNDPALILADEPTGNLDTATGDMVLNTFKRLRDAGKTIVLITHEPDVAAHADRVVHIRDGRLYEGPHLGAADGEGARP